MSGVDRAAASVFGAHVLWCRQALVRRDVIEKRGQNARRPKAAFPRGRQLSHPLEPTSPSDIEPGTEIAAGIVRRANTLGAHLLVHPETIRELASDRNLPRHIARRTLLAKYEELTHPPDLSEVERVLGKVSPESNHWFDHHLLAALHADAVHHLITDDEQMHRKARRLGISPERILTLTDARALLDTLADHPQNPPPQVRTRPLHALRRNAPIFESLRGDYPSFDRWFPTGESGR